MLVKFVAFWFLLCIVHFNDFFFQSQAQALAKTRDWKIRTRHCAEYSTWFMAFFTMMGLNISSAFVLTLWVFATHWLEDTYIPVIWWAKYARQAPEFKENITDYEAFVKFISTPIGVLLSVVIDQMVHIITLALPALYMARYL